MQIFRLNLEACDMESFIHSWSALYDYEPNGSVTTADYYRVIEIDTYTEDDLRLAFEWKSGVQIYKSRLTEYLDQYVLPNLKILNDLKKTIQNLKSSTEQEKKLKSFLIEIKRNKSSHGTVWDTFLIHLIAPKEFPIFDQHVYRAYMAIQHGIIDELKHFRENTSRNVIIDFYFSKYAKFYRKTMGKSKYVKQLDDALFAYGKFLISEIGKRLTFGQYHVLDRRLINQAFRLYHLDPAQLTTETSAYLSKNPGKLHIIRELLQMRDEYRLNRAYNDVRARMLDELKSSGIELDQHANDTQFIISLCCALQDKIKLDVDVIHTFLVDKYSKKS